MAFRFLSLLRSDKSDVAPQSVQPDPEDFAVVGLLSIQKTWEDSFDPTQVIQEEILFTLKENPFGKRRFDWDSSEFSKAMEAHKEYFPRLRAWQNGAPPPEGTVAVAPRWKHVLIAQALAATAPQTAAPAVNGRKCPADQLREHARNMLTLADGLSMATVKATVRDGAHKLFQIADAVADHSRPDRAAADLIDYHIPKAVETLVLFVRLSEAPDLSTRETRMLEDAAAILSGLPDVLVGHLRRIREDEFGMLEDSSRSLQAITLCAERPSDTPNVEAAFPACASGI